MNDVCDDNTNNIKIIKMWHKYIQYSTSPVLFFFLNQCKHIALKMYSFDRPPTMTTVSTTPMFVI